MELFQLVSLFGIPTAITGFAIWWVKHKIEANEKKHEQREKNLESLVLMMMESTRANTNLCVDIGEEFRDCYCN